MAGGSRPVQVDGYVGSVQFRGKRRKSVARDDSIDSAAEPREGCERERSSKHAPVMREGLDSFAEAEAALAKVVADNHDARVLRDEMTPPAERLIERMSDAGFGESVQIRAADVLVRLRSAAGLQAAPLIESTSNIQ